jgi:hypothetical protein
VASCLKLARPLLATKVVHRQSAATTLASWLGSLGQVASLSSTMTLLRPVCQPHMTRCTLEWTVDRRAVARLWVGGVDRRPPLAPWRRPPSLRLATGLGMMMEGGGGAAAFAQIHETLTILIQQAVPPQDRLGINSETCTEPDGVRRGGPVIAREQIASCGRSLSLSSDPVFRGAPQPTLMAEREQMQTAVRCGVY